TVNLAGDAGLSSGALSGDVRYCVGQANDPANAGSTIVFDAQATGPVITLSKGELAIGVDMTVQGPGAGLLTISGNHASRVFDVQGGTVRLADLTISDGFAPPNAPLPAGPSGGGIYNAGTLTVSGCTLSGNSASYGGGIYNFSGIYL